LSPQAYRSLQIARLKAKAQRRTQTEYKFRGAALEAQSSNYREIILTGPTRTGKTLALLHKGYQLSQKYNGMRLLVVRKRRSDLSETGLVTLERDLIGLSHPLIVDGPSRRFRSSYDFTNGSTIVIGGLDKPGKVLSSEYDMIIVIQGEELVPSEWEILITRLSGRALPPHMQQIVGDCNPASPYHWIMQRSLSGQLKLWDTFHKDNPMLFDAVLDDWTEFGSEYLNRLSASLTGIERERLLEGKWVQAEGVVYSEFGNENLTDDEPDWTLDDKGYLLHPFEIAVDDGYIDPRVFMLIQRTGNQILIFDEIYHSRHLEETCVRELQDRCAMWSDLDIPKELAKSSIEERAKWTRENDVQLPEIAIGAPEAKTLHRYLRMADIPVRNIPIPTVIEAIKPVRTLIRDGNGYRALKVNRRCKNLISEFTDGYKYPEEGSRKDDEKPIDENNHAVDAVRDWVWARARS
jgi:phage terminase large subunit